MNENISQYLSKYIINPDPRYAVMLKGKWGCGKSFFVQNWIKDYQEETKKSDAVLEPIYVSLYGLKETSQITEAIDRALRPFLYSKGAEWTKKICKIAGKLIFKTSFDLDNNGTEDISMDATLDSLSLLASRNNDSEVGTKIIMFDDLERCLIDMKLLLGYINGFVEHGACHVIIVGDETHTTEDAKKQLLEFKEKTVGREFEIQPDVEAAINSFLIDDVPLAKWLTKQKYFIIDCFKATNCDNLRILRQCLYDFSTLYDELDVNLIKKGDLYIKSVLGSYIATYCEYRGEHHAILKDWDKTYFWGVLGDDTKKDTISIIQSKYAPIFEKYQIDVLNTEHIKKIIHEIETGCSIKPYIEDTLRQITGDISALDRLAEFVKLSNEEFETAYSELEQDVKGNNTPNPYILGRAISMFVFFDYSGIHSLSKTTIASTKKHITKFYASIDNKDDLYSKNASFIQGVNSYGQIQTHNLGKDIISFATAQYERRENELKNRMEDTLLTLNDENVEMLIKLSNEPTPDHHCCYNMTSIFRNIDAQIFANNILNLSNYGLDSLRQFFSIHYEFHCILGDGCNRFSEDLPTLTKVKDIVEKELPNRVSVNKYMLTHLLRYIKGAISRASGENEAINLGN